jgi:signal recognition particle GTPase
MVVHVPTLEDIRKQLQRLRADGIDALPGFTEITAEDKVALEQAERILEAMTEEERKNVDLLLDVQVRKRIASQSGVQLRDVEELISQVAKVRLAIRKLLPAST